MLNRSASLAMSTSILKALPGKFDIKRHEPCILFIMPICYFGRMSLNTVQLIHYFEVNIGSTLKRDVHQGKAEMNITEC